MFFWVVFDHCALRVKLTAIKRFNITINCAPQTMSVCKWKKRDRLCESISSSPSSTVFPSSSKVLGWLHYHYSPELSRIILQLRYFRENMNLRGEAWERRLASPTLTAPQIKKYKNKLAKKLSQVSQRCFAIIVQLIEQVWWCVWWSHIKHRSTY